MIGMRGSPIAGICSMAVRHVLAELNAAFAGASGCGVTLVAAGGVDVARRLHEGEGFDFAVLAADALEALVAAGRVVAASRTDIARSGMGVAVAAGSPMRRFETEADTRGAVLQAQSIGYSTGPSGAHLLSLLERWGIARDVSARLRQAPPGIPVATMVAGGEAEIGFQQVSELIDVPAIDVFALPAAIQKVTVFAGAICTSSTRREDTARLLAFLASAACDGTKRRNGMESAAA